MPHRWQACASRETKEETNLDVTNFEFFTCTNDVYSAEKHYVTIFMRAKLDDTDQQVPLQMEPTKSTE